MKNSLLILTAIYLFTCCGCAINRDVRINSKPAGAGVFASSKLLGTTPVITDIDALFPNRASDFQPSASRTLVFKKDGYQDATITVTEFSVPPVIEVTLTPVSGVTADDSNSSSTERKLRDLKKFLDDGLITEKEYSERKKAILDKL
jgi:hypothetical protein